MSEAPSEAPYAAGFDKARADREAKARRDAEAAGKPPPKRRGPQPLPIPADATPEERAAIVKRRAGAAERAARFRERRRAKKALGLAATAETPADAEAAARRFAPGNKLALTHGAKDPEVVNPLAAQIREAMLKDPQCPPWLHDSTYGHVVLAWAYAEAQVRLMRVWVDAQGMSAAMTEIIDSTENEDGLGSGKVVRKSHSRRRLPLLGELHRAEVRAAGLRKDLGLTPASRASLGKDVAGTGFDLARMWAEMDARDAAASAPDAKGIVRFADPQGPEDLT